MKFNEEEFIPSFSAQEVAELKSYAKKHRYTINWRERLIYDMQGCHKAYLLKNNDGHLCAVSNGIKEDITENIQFAKIIANSIKEIRDTKQNTLFRQIVSGDVFGLVSLTHTNVKEEPCQ